MSKYPFDCSNMPVSLATFAKYLAKEGCYYYWGNVTVYAYYTKSGSLKFWSNAKGEESRSSPNLKKILDDAYLETPTHEKLRKSSGGEFLTEIINENNARQALVV